MKDLPQIGNGFDIVSGEAKTEALIINEKKDNFPSRPVSLQTIVINSTEDLQKLTKVSLGIAADLPKLGLSLDIGASSNNRLDANNIYYLIVLTAGHHKKIAEPQPRLNEFACRTLGIDSPEIRKASASVMKAEKDIEKITADADKLAVTIKDAQSKFELKEKDLVEAQAQVDTLRELFPGDKLPGQLEKLVSAQAKLTIAKSSAQIAKTNLEETEAKKKEKDAALKHAQDLLKTYKLELENLTEQAGALVSHGIEDFNSIFGTHYVKEVQYGRQLLALVTVDRRKLQSSKEYNADLKIKPDDALKFGSSLNYKKDRVTEEALVKITISSKGLNASIMSPPETLAELDILIKSYYDKGFKDGQEDVPSEPIDVVLESYSSVLRSYKIDGKIAKFSGKIDEAESIISRSLELRDRAVRCLVTRIKNKTAIRV